MNAQHVQRKPRYGLYTALVALGVAAAITQIGFSLLAASYVFGGVA